MGSANIRRRARVRSLAGASNWLTEKSLFQNDELQIIQLLIY